MLLRILSIAVNILSAHCLCKDGPWSQLDLQVGSGTTYKVKINVNNVCKVEELATACGDGYECLGQSPMKESVWEAFREAKQ